MNATLKKTLIIVGAILLFLLIAFLGIGFLAGESEKTYSSHGFTITMADNFLEKDYASLTAYFESNKALVMVLKEDFSTLEAIGITSDSSLDDYAKAVFLSNNITSDIKIGFDGKFKYFEYQRTASGKDFSYIGVIVKGSDAFWLINFACASKDADVYHDKFLTWANTIKVN